jgi:cell division control protein 11
MPPKSRKKNATPLNIMVTGFSGVGKTAFVRTLCETLSDLDAEPIPELSGPLSKTEKPYPVSLDFDYEGERIALTVIDTPGFQVNTSIEKGLQDIIEYIEQQFDLTIAEVSYVACQSAPGRAGQGRGGTGEGLYICIVLMNLTLFHSRNSK